MPYDPNFPPTNAELISAEFREQFQGLKALLDAQAAVIAAQAATIASQAATIATHTGQLAAVQAQIDASLAGTSSNTNGVGSLSLVITTNPVELFQVQPIADKLDELITALRR